jgi:AcrR family transcriptional regulator
LAAAYDEFCEHGYARATTRVIADRSGVAESLLFRQFGSKAGLFNEVVFSPLRAFMAEWEKADAEAGDDLDLEARAKAFVGGLYDLLRTNRGLMLTYFATQVFEPEVIKEPGDNPTFVEVIRLMDKLAMKRTVANKRIDSRTKVAGRLRVHERISIGSVIAAALFEDLLFAEIRTRPNRDYIVDELARIAVVSAPIPEG